LIKGRERAQPARAARQQDLGLAAGRFLGRTRSTIRHAIPSQARSSAPQAPPAVQQYKTGDEVHHNVFGKGIVIESTPAGGDEQVTVAFAGVGLKRLMASMAHMEKIEGE
jgi:hypothetical protein